MSFIITFGTLLFPIVCWPAVLGGHQLLPSVVVLSEQPPDWTVPHCHHAETPVADWHYPGQPTVPAPWNSIQPNPSAWVDKGKGSLYSITERRVPELIPVLGSQPAGDVSHKPGGRLPLLFARTAVTPTTKRTATNLAAWWAQAQWVWTVCLRLLPDSVATAIWTQALLHLSPAR